MRTWQEREELVQARGAEFRAGIMTDDQFRAYLFRMRYRGEDLHLRMLDFPPPPAPPTYEDRRMEASREWLRSWKAARGR